MYPAVEFPSCEGCGQSLNEGCRLCGTYEYGKRPPNAEGVVEPSAQEISTGPRPSTCRMHRGVKEDRGLTWFMPVHGLRLVQFDWSRWTITGM